MQSTIFEHKGVLIQVNYTLGSDGKPDFDSAHSLDGDYRPVGCDLLPLLADCVMLAGPDVGDWLLNGVLRADPQPVDFADTTI